MKGEANSKRHTTIVWSTVKGTKSNMEASWTRQQLQQQQQQQHKRRKSARGSSITNGGQNTRGSLYSLRQAPTIADILLSDITKMGYEDRSWNLAYLKSRFKAPKELEALYNRYEQRSQIGTFTTYLLAQSVLSIGYIAWTAIHCRLEEDECNSLDVPPQLPDIVGQSALLAVCILMLLVVYNERIFKQKPWLLYLFSAIIAFSMEVIDVGLVIYHSLSNGPLGKSEPAVTSSYTEPVSKTPLLSLYNHLVIYLFLPISRKDVTVAFGVLTSLVCVFLFLGIEISQDHLEGSQIATQVMADLVFYASLNFVGFYVRYVGEINMRRGFLDKRGCIETTFKLKHEKEQVENLLLSIIPKHIATKVRDEVWSHIRSGDSARTPFRELVVENHDNTSILFADICKFTELTTTLPVDKLVETLNDLFGKFDDAAEVHKCLRIKILGDCYYCISGVPVEDALHADHCVKMGLQMINLIRDVRHEHKVNVNMRIGVNSGHVLSGLIGVKKWQFDIWSKDVTIANRLEATGTAGAVHISQTTKSYLKGHFDCEPVKKAHIDHDEILHKHDVTTFLIWPEDRKKPTQRLASSLPLNSPSIVSAFDALSPAKGKDGGHDDEKDTLGGDSSNQGGGPHSGRKRSVLMDKSVINYQKLLNSAGEFMREEIEKLPLRKYDQWLHPDEINPVLLMFRDKSWEKPYLQEHDPLFKFYILASFVILNAMGIILLLTEKHPHIPLWIEYTVLFVFLSLLLPCLWVSYIWDQIIDPHYENDNIAEPNHRLLRFFYHAAKKINTSLVTRTVIYIVVAVLIITSALLDVTTATCLAETPKNYTYRCALAIMVIFMFLRIHHLLKIFTTIACLTFFGVIILGDFPTGKYNIFSLDYFGYNELFNNEAKKYTHFAYLFVCALFFLLMDRQHEFMRRLDYQWKRQLKSEQKQASDTKCVNRMLLENILPYHVAEHYLSSNRKTGHLYCETYRNVAVLFASIPNYLDFFTETEIRAEGVRNCLKILNEIVAGFDKLLFEEQFKRVEKIKMISSTFMGACGLKFGRKRSSQDRRRSSSVGCELYTKGENARTMAQFASALMKVLDNHNKKSLETFQLRIGFHVGPVIAGVVGAQKPLYDIWGDTVNVASRMDYTGLLGKIQVPKATAECLKTERVSCSYREVVRVKGKGPMETYTVDLNEDHSIRYLDDIENDPTSDLVRPSRLLLLSQNDEDEQIQEGRFTVTPASRKRSTAENPIIEPPPLSRSSSDGSLNNHNSFVVEAVMHESGNLDSEEDKRVVHDYNNKRHIEENVMNYLDNVIKQNDDDEEERSASPPPTMTSKKDSGYGSQGQLKVDKVKTVFATDGAGRYVDEEVDDEFVDDNVADDDKDDVQQQKVELDLERYYDCFPQDYTNNNSNAM